MSEPLNGWYWAKWGKNQPMKPVQFVQNGLWDGDGITASDFAEIGPPIPSVEECRAIAAAKLPPRTDGWSADGRVCDPWFGVSAAERERQCEQVRREIAEAHRPKEGGWRFTTLQWGCDYGCYVFSPGGSSWFVTSKRFEDVDMLNVESAVSAGRQEITAAEAWARLAACSASVRAKFIELTGYVP
jgi:hypothetical protein